jgi:hypothetical protein
MAKYLHPKEMMIDDIAIEIENFDPNIHNEKAILESPSFPLEFNNLSYFVDNHKKLFLLDYYKFFGIESVEKHPQYAVAQDQDHQNKVNL